MINMYKAVIGLEVHVELACKSKMFCGCNAEHFGKTPNSQVCPVCLGLPGALPYANKQAIEDTIKFGIALGCKINKFSKFDRKHYFYPDLPKGYQISQYDEPLCYKGNFQLSISDLHKSIRITRVHLEEDTAKMVHEGGESLVDYNRSGVALMEMVTEPDFESPEEVDIFLKEIQLVVRYLEISSADMEKGSMRLEANISMRKEGDKKLPDYKVELKNINSFRFLRKALEEEIKRQNEALERGEKIIQETRGYDEISGRTFAQRTKEEARDYRYFPEPDIPPIRISDKQLSNLKQEVPEMPREKRERFREKYGLSEEYVEFLTAERARAEYFEECLALDRRSKFGAKMIAGVMVNQRLDKKYPEPAGLVAELVRLSKKDYASGEEVEGAVKKVVKENKKAVEDYQRGKGEVVGFLIGKVQKILGGKGEAGMIREKLSEILQGDI